MRLLRLFVAALWLVALGLSAAPAHAGTITVALPTWENRVPDRLANLLNRRDCHDDAVASFNVSFSAVTNGAFEVWSGSACDQAANRQTSTVIQTCVRVSAQNMGITNQVVKVHFRDMVAPAGTTPDGSIGECNSPQSVGLQTRTLYFVVFDMNNPQTTLATGTNTAWPFKYDISAPPPPANVEAFSGDGSLVTTFTPPTGETNLLHYHFYCSPQGPVPTATGGTGGTAGTDTGGTAATGATAGTDAGGTAGTDTGGTAGADTGGTAGTDTGGTAGTDATAGTAGTDATAGSAGTDGTAGTAGTAPMTLDASCTSALSSSGMPILAPGTDPQDLPAGWIDCGTVGAQGAKGGETAQVLGNDSGYAVAVATEDTLNNVGVLSGLACATPKDITGFFEAYRQAGGQAGGGYCTFAPARPGAVAGALGFLLGACALLARRRR